MPLEHDIVSWSESRPDWQRAVLRLFALGEVVGTADIAAIADQLLDPASPASASAPIALEDITGGMAVDDQVSLHSCRPVAHVNALLDGQTLTFGKDGLTVVYGDNASGKSGYARILKQVTGARHQEPVLTNVFIDRADDDPVAIVTVEIGGELHEHLLGGTPNPAVHRISYFDDACGDAYISTESVVTYRPSALTLLDGLIATCDGVRAEIDRRLEVNAGEKPALPEPATETVAANFLATLSSKTTPDAITEACELPDDPGTQLAALRAEEARLTLSDPGKERIRWNGAADHFETLRAHAVELTGQLGAQAAIDLAGERSRATELRAAASTALSATFDELPVGGVGSDTWRTLWEAARRFVEEDALPGSTFPSKTDGAFCPLCQQRLSSEASDRFHRFHEYLSNDVEQQAEAAESTLRIRVDRISTLAVTPNSVAVALASLEDADLVDRYGTMLTVFDARKIALLAPEPEPVTPFADALEGVEVELATMRDDARARALAIDAEAFAGQVAAATTARAEFEGRQALTAGKDAIELEVGRLRRREALERLKKDADTAQITRKSTELTRNHVNDVLRDQFTRRTERLRLRRVTLKDGGGQKGQLKQRPTLLDASQLAQVSSVLSEGEQTALGLAGFLTEAYFDETESTLILDDPVTSLDHIRRGFVAEELVEFARTRQVIVFTHELMFVGELQVAAEIAGVSFTPRRVEGKGASFGACYDELPWKAQDVGARFGTLDHDLARLKRERATWNEEEYGREAAAWAGLLSETWERIVNLEVVHRVIDAGTSQVRPMAFRVLARITEDDNLKFQHSYSKVSRWARRHDKPLELNYVPPEVDELQAELAQVRSWHQRIRKYANSN